MEKLGPLNHAVVLGIIESSGTVRLQTADAVVCPGHVEWMKQDKLKSWRAFSLGIDQGSVKWLMLRSVLNPPPRFRLERDLAQSLIDLLPCAPTVRVFFD